MNSTRGDYFLERDALEPGECVLRSLDPSLGPGWLHFGSSPKIVSTREVSEVEDVLSAVEAASREGCHAVGFVDYAAGRAFEPRLTSLASSMPLAWFALYEAAPTWHRELLPVYEFVRPQSAEYEWDLAAYAARFSAVREALRNGDVYQANLTSRVKFELACSGFEFFRAVCGVRPPPYATYIEGADWQICSFSPEMFLERRGTLISMAPMKGTRPEGPEPTDLTSDTKSLAENLMIVDMVRNDLGKIADVGSVRTPTLFQVQSHRTVRQMVSRVEANSDASLEVLFRSTFPPASVTGAPKLAACELIDRLESNPRGVYCGAIGCVEPGHDEMAGDFRFAVAIRTAVRHVATGRTTYGIGSGLVWDSEVEDEFHECRLKAEILWKPAPQWELIEVFHRDALAEERLLAPHYARFKRSADRLGIRLERSDFDHALEPLRIGSEKLPIKIRVLLRQTGDLSVSASESLVSGNALKAAIAASCVSSQDPNLIHKTSSRQVYEDALGLRPDVDEVLLHNERGEVAEFCRGNALFRFGTRWVTPRTESGCLAGIGVQRVIESGLAEYGVIRLSEAWSCDEVQFINSIRGRIPVSVVP